jgi:1,4-dihydroxy-2-naphthoate octaprenyltransferase
MRILGILVILLGWLIAVSSVEVSSTGLQIIVTLLGLGVISVGIMGILNQAHLKNAIWKQ